MDRSFLVPKVGIYLNILTPYLRSNEKDYLILLIFYNYLNANLESSFADVKDTGGEIALTFDENGYVLNLNLFSDLVPKIIDRLLSLIFSSSMDESTFNQYYHLSMEDVNSYSEEQPYKKAKELFNKIVKFNVSGHDEVINLNKKEKLNFTTFTQNFNEILKSFSINSLFYGYYTKANLDILITKINTYLDPNTNLQFKSNFEIVDYLHNHKSILEPVIFKIKNDLPSEKNHVVYNYFQVGKRDYKNSLMMNIVEMMWGNMFYYYLRTIKQLGYIVSANKEFIDKYMYFSFVVQGNKKDPSSLNFEIDNILASLRDKINSLPENKLNEIITSIENELHKKDTNLKERTKKVWNEIVQNTLDFDRKEQLLKYLTKITKKDILDFFDNIFIDRPHKLSIQIYSGESKSLNSEGEEIYYLNANLKYMITSDLKILNDI